MIDGQSTDRIPNICLQAQVEQLKVQLAVQPRDIMEPGVDVLVGQLADAEAREAALQSELEVFRDAQQKAEREQGAGGGLRGMLTRAQLQAAREENKRLHRRNEELHNDLRVCSHAVSIFVTQTCTICSYLLFSREQCKDHAHLLLAFSQSSMNCCDISLA
jgi:hypothetical protein